jgi:hypothetical protein
VNDHARLLCARGGHRTHAIEAATIVSLVGVVGGCGVCKHVKVSAGHAVTMFCVRACRCANTTRVTRHMQGCNARFTGDLERVIVSPCASGWGTTRLLPSGYATQVTCDCASSPISAFAIEAVCGAAVIAHPACSECHHCPAMAWRCATRKSRRIRPCVPARWTMNSDELVGARWSHATCFQGVREHTAHQDVLLSRCSEGVHDVHTCITLTP